MWSWDNWNTEEDPYPGTRHCRRKGIVLTSCLITMLTGAVQLDWPSAGLIGSLQLSVGSISELKVRPCVFKNDSAISIKALPD